MQDVKQRYTGLAPAVARYSTSPQGLSIRPTPHLESDLLSDEEDLATLSYNSMSATPIVATPLLNTDTYSAHIHVRHDPILLIGPHLRAHDDSAHGIAYFLQESGTIPLN